MLELVLPKSMPSRRRYTSEQKAEVVRLVRVAGMPPVMVAQRLGIHLANVSRWVLDALHAEQSDPRARRRELLARSRSDDQG